MNGPQVTAVAGFMVSVVMPCSIPLRPAGRKRDRPSPLPADRSAPGDYDPGIVRSRGLQVITAALTVLCVAACSPDLALPRPTSHPHSTVTTTAPGARQTPAQPPAQPAFHATVTALSSSWRGRLRYTWHPDCPQPLAGLALIRMTYWGFDKRAHTGELGVNAAVTRKI